MNRLYDEAKGSGGARGLVSGRRIRLINGAGIAAIDTSVVFCGSTVVLGLTRTCRARDRKAHAGQAEWRLAESALQAET